MKDSTTLSTEDDNTKPFKLRLIFPDSNAVKLLTEVTSPTILDVNGKLHSEGLYSNEIFGVIGSPERNRRFAYIDLNVNILHPLIYTHFSKLSSLYDNIMKGKKYAIWDDKVKDFIPTNPDEGNTGYSFFLSKIKDIKIPRNESKKRDAKIDMIEEYRSKGTLTNKYLLVLPAGLREFQEDNDRIVEDEVNDMYRAILGASSLFKNNTLSSGEMHLLDTARYKLQLNVVKIYDYFISVNDGKHKFLNGKWTKRGIENGTANVATSIPVGVTDMDSEDNVNINHTIMGLFQYSKGISPITGYNLMTRFLTDIFTDGSNQAMLVNKKTLKTVLVDVKQKTKDKWITQDGLNNILNKLVDDNVKNEIVTVGNNYLGLVYDTGKEVKYIKNTETLPDGIDESKIRPIRYGELFFISIYDTIGKYPGYMTRYPITGQGSIFPSFPKIRTTTKDRTIKYYPNILFDDNVRMYSYPTLDGEWVNSISSHYSKLSGLGLDYDGDVELVLLRNKI